MFFFFISWQKRGNQRRNPIESHVLTLRQQETDDMKLLLDYASIDWFLFVLQPIFSNQSEQDTCTWNQKWLLKIRLITVCVSAIFVQPLKTVHVHMELISTNNNKKLKNTNDFSDRRKTISEKKRKPTKESLDYPISSLSANPNLWTWKLHII